MPVHPPRFSGVRPQAAFSLPLPPPRERAYVRMCVLAKGRYCRFAVKAERLRLEGPSSLSLSSSSSSSASPSPLPYKLRVHSGCMHGLRLRR